jgi:hypothetical protein
VIHLKATVGALCAQAVFIFVTRSLIFLQFTAMGILFCELKRSVFHWWSNSVDMNATGKMGH